MPVQVNGKVRSRLTVPPEASEKELERWRSPILP